MKDGLTAKQQEVYDFVAQYWRENEMAPTVQEIASNFGISEPGMRSRIEAMLKKGFLKQKPGCARTLRCAK